GLAKDVADALAEWNTVDPDVRSPLADGAKPGSVEPRLSPGTDRDSFAKLVQDKGKGRVIALTAPAQVGRALDLLEDPVPTQDVERVGAVCAPPTRLTDVSLFYSPATQQEFGEPAQLGYHLFERGFISVSLEEVKKAGMRRQTVRARSAAYDICVNTAASG